MADLALRVQSLRLPSPVGAWKVRQGGGSAGRPGCPHGPRRCRLLWLFSSAGPEPGRGFSDGAYLDWTMVDYASRSSRHDRLLRDYNRVFPTSKYPHGLRVARV